MVEGGSKLKPPTPILLRRHIVMKYTPNLHLVPEEFGRPAARMARLSKHVGFSRACIETCVPYELNLSLRRLTWRHLS